MGTGLATHGIKHLVKDFAKALHKRAGKVVFVNLTEPAEQGAKNNKPAKTDGATDTR